MGKLLTAVQEKYIPARELRGAPEPNYTSGGTFPSRYFNERRDAEFGLEETKLRLQRQLSRMTSDQLDQVYLNLDDEFASQIDLIDFQNKASDPRSDGSWISGKSTPESDVLKLAEALEKTLPPEQADNLADEINGIKPMSDPDYPKEEKYDYPVQNEIQQLKDNLPPDQQTEENLKLLDEINEETRMVSGKYFDYIKKVTKSGVPFDRKTAVSGMEEYADHVMYGYTDMYFQHEGKGFAKDLEKAKSKSRNSLYDVVYDNMKISRQNTPEFMNRLPELEGLESGISDETMADVESVMDDFKKIGSDDLKLNGFINQKCNAPRAESGGKTYALTAVAQAKQDLQDAVKTGNMEEIRKAHEKYKFLKETTDHMMETARTKPEKGQSEVFEGNMDALRGESSYVPDEYLLDFAGHSKLAGLVTLYNYSEHLGIPMKDIMKKPVATALKATEMFAAQNGINSGKTAGAKLVDALSAEKASYLTANFAASTAGVIQRGLETLGGFAHSKEEAERLVGQAVLAECATYGVMEAKKDTWMNLAKSAADKQQRLYERVLLTPEDQLNMEELAQKFEKKNWKSELSTEKLLKETVGKGGFDYEALIQKADKIKADAEDAVDELDDPADSNYRSSTMDRATVITFRKVLEAAPEQDRQSPGYQKLQAEVERRSLELEPKEAESDLDAQIAILAREKTGLFVNKENSVEHQRMMKSLQDLQTKKRLLRGDTEGVSPAEQDRLKKISLDQAIRTARKDTMAYSRKVEEDGRKTSFKYGSGANRANAAIHTIEALDKMADATGGRTPVQKMEDMLQRDTMDSRKDAEQVVDNAARSLYLNFIKNNPQKFTPEIQETDLANGKMKKAVNIFKQDPAFQKMVKTLGTGKLADQVINGPDSVMTSYLDATKALDSQAIGKSGSEMTAEERKEFMQNATFAENKNPEGMEI